MTPSERELFGILKGVSRSFYISVRFLPKRIRLTIALAYLLARASDTIADANGTEPQLRREFLAQFLKQIRDGDFNPSLKVTPFLANQAEGPEKTLLLHINPVVQSLGLIATQHRELIAEVLSKIIHGQTLDIQRFEMRPGTQGLSDDGSLDEYTYLVAGSVGEFWTKVCLLEWRGYSDQPEAKLLGMGRDFGNGLQLINILRDFSNDLRQGRSYLPVTNLEIVAADPNLARSEWERWRQRALSYLEGGWQYVNAVRPPRVRFACAVPLFIGVHTLDLLGKEPKLHPGIKLPRSEVKSLMCWAAALAWFPVLKGYIRQRIFR
ncbi:MAG TPA: squalene/phytoene synthase family protein [Chthoniobacterales bacterium]|jgi:farnesyl-diphosphate farnesyltransferase|nr:squalene/phytoene synthase family protein [Chthoniobacterales bacterium]